MFLKGLVPSSFAEETVSSVQTLTSRSSSHVPNRPPQRSVSLACKLGADSRVNLQEAEAKGGAHGPAVRDGRPEVGPDGTRERLESDEHRHTHTHMHTHPTKALIDILEPRQAINMYDAPNLAPPGKAARNQ